MSLHIKYKPIKKNEANPKKIFKKSKIHFIFFAKFLTLWK
ncbi:MAG: hypothetical protein BWY70_00602 [Bacteroidetes bacterium ADurb.Bin408]|nr:MAG: hypothetical protein BWY70_00602 [Bacteroidetes bacterium ADurb.Bin408]